jgi:hypothetical protein
VDSWIVMIKRKKDEPGVVRYRSRNRYRLEVSVIMIKM